MAKIRFDLEQGEDLNPKQDLSLANAIDSLPVDGIVGRSKGAYWDGKSLDILRADVRSIQKRRSGMMKADTLLPLFEIGRRLPAATTREVGMINEDYMHLAEKLRDARRALMLPHPKGETESIVNAFSECAKVLRIQPTPDLDDSASGWAETILALMDTSKFDESAGDGTWDLMASSLSVEDKYELSNAVDQLANWAHSKFYGDD